jgi:hypothetical protein
MQIILCFISDYHWPNCTDDTTKSDASAVSATLLLLSEISFTHSVRRMIRFC